jgi:ribosomal protein L7Ae-like RNA K-turn-binding protein
MACQASEENRLCQAESAETEMSSKKHYFSKAELPEADKDVKVMTLLQFARKAGKLIHGFEVCKKEVMHGKVKLLLVTTDLSDNAKDKIMNVINLTGSTCSLQTFGTQEELSAALGLPFTGIIGILDNNFAKKILSYIEQ